jgi:hypothetical protein
MSIQRFFGIIYQVSYASDTGLLAFASDHRGKLNANNPGGKYDALLAALTAAMADFQERFREEDREVNLRQEMTLRLAAARADALEFIREAEKILAYTYRASPEVMEEFYPYGMGEYTHATQQELCNLLARFRDAVEKHSGELPPGMPGEIAGLRQDYQAAYDNQKRQKGDVSGMRLASGRSRDALEDQLMRNLYALASDYLRRPAMAAVYFDESIITPGRAAEGNNPESPPAGEEQPH